MFFRDLAFALRSFAKTPLFTIVVVATLAVAIGANATAFSILRGVVLAPLPYGSPTRLVSIFGTASGKPFALSIPDFLDLRVQNRTMSSMAAYFPGSQRTLADRGRARKLSGVVATSNFFDVLGVHPLLGRTLSPVDARLGSPEVIIISHELWVTYFRGDPSIVGKIVRMDGVADRVIGIMPASFKQPGFTDGFEPTDFWAPLKPGDPMYVRSSHYATGVARLRRDVTVAAVRDDLEDVFARLRVRYPLTDSHSGVDIASLQDALVGSVRPVLFAIFAAVAVVVLVACANVSNLLLSRAATRDRELAVRAAVGASRVRIMAQLLTETFVVAACGGIIGFMLAYVAVHALVQSNPPTIPRIADVTLDSAAALYTFGIVAFCTLAAGLAPAVTLPTQRFANVLNASGRGGDASRGAAARTALAIVEIALTFALVVASGLVVRSYVSLTQQPLGFNPNDVLVGDPLTLPDNRYRDDQAQLAVYDRIGHQVNAIPGVRVAEWADAAPFMNRTSSLKFEVVGHHSAAGAAGIGIIGPSYFRVLSIPVLRGRGFGTNDGYKSPRVVVVNAALAHLYFGDRAVLGAHVWLKFPIGTSADLASKTPVLRSIVGVVDDVRNSYGKAVGPKMYLPLQQAPFSGMLLVAKTTPHAPVAEAIAGSVTAADPLLAAPELRLLDSFLDQDTARARLSTLALLALALVASVLSIAGVYAIVSYGVAQRTHELGVRMALGARASHILNDVLGQSMRVVAIGVLAGIVLAAICARAIAAQLYQITPIDPLTFGVVIIVVSLASATAALVPAMRAMRLDPIVALRYE